MQALLGQRAHELAGEARARAEVLHAPEDAQLRDELLGVVEDRRARERQAQAVRGHGAGQAADGLGALGLRVLDEVGLVDDERAQPEAAERLAVGGDDLEVHDRDLVGRRRRRAPLDDRDPAVGQPLAGLALPDALERGGADHDGREGVVGLERGQRLHRLAEALLVGQEAAAGVERVADAGPLERLQRAAELRGDLGQRLALGGARPADLVGGLGVLGAQVLEGLGRVGLDRDPVEGQEAVEGADDPGVQRQRAPAASTPGRRSKASPESGSHSASRRRRSPSVPWCRTSRAGGTVSSCWSSCTQRLAAASSRAEPSSAIAAAAAGTIGTSSAPSTSVAMACSSSGSVPARGSRRNQPRPSWRAVRTRPIQRRRTLRSQRSTSVLVESSGARSSTSSTCTPAQSSAGADHWRLSQSKRRPGIARTKPTSCGS